MEGAATPWDRAKALEQYFTAGDFTYDLEPELGDGIDSIDAFLTTRRGFCQQFAASYAALARAVGLPARVVVGFTPGEYVQADNEYIVRGRDAHAWVEVWFAGLGWRAFEPTPAGPLPGQAVPAGTGAEVGDPAADATRTPTTTRAPAPAPDANNARGPGAPVGARDARISTGSSAGDSALDPRTKVLVAGLGLGALVGLGVIVRRLWRPRRRRRSRRRDPVVARRVTGAWNEALRACTAAGLPVNPACTPAEQVRALVTAGLPDAAQPPLSVLAEIHSRAQYAPVTITEAEGRDAWLASESVRSRVAEQVSGTARWRQALRSNTDQLVGTSAP